MKNTSVLLWYILPIFYIPTLYITVYLAPKTDWETAHFIYCWEVMNCIFSRVADIYLIISLIKCTTNCKPVTVWNIYCKDQVQVCIGRAVLLSHHRMFIHYKLIQRIYTSPRKCCQLEMASTPLCSFRPLKSNWYIRRMCTGAYRVQVLYWWIMSDATL